MKKVYIVEEGEYSDRHTVGVFSSMAKAKKYCEKNAADIDEWIVDELCTMRMRTIYSSKLDPQTGNLKEETSRQEEQPKNYTYSWCTMNYCGAESVRSAAHARKLAAERRQAWLRENPPRRFQKAGFDPEA